MLQNIATFAIERPLYTWLLIAVCVFGGWWGIQSVGRLEDPNFPVKMAYIVTSYSGASAVEVEQEVTDALESALQELPYLDHMISKSVPGRSEIEVEMIESITEEEIPQVWDELRRRVGEAYQRMPPGVDTPHVEDDFGDVYGMLYAITIDGFTPADIADVSRRLETGLSGIPGVAKVTTAGEPIDALYVDISHERLTRLGLPLEQVLGSIGTENRVLPAGTDILGNLRVRIAPEMAFDTVDAVGDMRIGQAGTTGILRLRDIATISRQPLDPQFHLIHHNGKRVITVGVSVDPEQNVVNIGHQIDARMTALSADLPLGMEVIQIYAQHDAVEAAINAFLWNLAGSVLSVFAALFVFMGWRAGVVVGSVLFLTVLGTLYLMALFGIELQRISLGALMIAMGMLVDNAIVIAEGMVVGVRLGMTPSAAAAQSTHRTQWPLLGATLIGILAFAPIGLSDDNSGYFLRSLFQVIVISLLLSWILAITVVPLFGKYLLVPSRDITHSLTDDDAIYTGWTYAPYRKLLSFGLRRAWLTTFVMVGVVAACFWGAQFVKPGFFPTTNTPLFYVDVHLAQGADIEATRQLVADLEKRVLDEPGVTDISAFTGRGATRFAAVFRPQQPNSAYAQLVVRVDDVTRMSAIMDKLRFIFRDAAIPADLQFYRMEFSPSGNSKIEARISGPDANILRELADEVNQVYLRHNLIDRKTNWRQRAVDVVPHFDTTQARRAGITRSDVWNTIAFATSGVNVGLFRDDDKLVSIIARAPAEERGNLPALGERLVWSPAQQQHVPMSQVVSRFSLEPADDLIWRRDRERTINVLANPPPGHNPTHVFNAMRADVEALPLPHGYDLHWGGEFEGAADANRLLFEKIPLTFGSMFLITILLFGRMRQAIVIWLTVPMMVCGVVLSLIATDLTFTFPAFLGFLSLSGMLLKNCIVLVDEMDKRSSEQGLTLHTLNIACISRLRPVLLAAGTTVFGMAPLLTDAFFREMAVAIMGGLTFATLITLLAVPVFYRIALGRRVIS